ncbi:MAG: 30S ribosomal protein S3 [Patescibacteria group bacterium]
MGQKIHPKIFRIGVIYSWSSKWFGTRRNMPELLREDTRIREFLWKKLKEASIDRIEIDRTPRAVTVTIHTAKPGYIIGRGGSGVETLKTEVKKMIGKGRADDKQRNLNLNIVEVTKPSLSSNIILQSMIADIEKRVRFRRALKTHLDRVQKAGAKGCKILIKGRLNGAEIAREEKVSYGSIPLQNLRADIDFAQGFARTIFGTIGIKVWIYRGEVFAENAGRPQKEKLGEVVSKPKA